MLQQKNNRELMKSILKKIFNFLPAPPNTNYALANTLPNPYAQLAADAVIYDIGSKDSRGKYKFGSPPEFAKVICVDIEDGPGVDLVADAQDMHMVVSESVDFVCLVSVLPHVQNPPKVIEEVFRILKPGGMLYISTPFVYPYHTDPYDFYRFSPGGLKMLCRNFESLHTGFNRGPASTMTHLLVHFLAIFFCFNSSAIHTLNIYIFKWLLFWLKYADIIIGRYKMAHIIHSGAYILAQKPKIMNNY